MSEREKPTITITFDGLVLLHFAEDKETNKSWCDAMILRVEGHPAADGQQAAAAHDFKIDITGAPIGEPAFPKNPLTGDLVFKVIDAPKKVSRISSRPFSRVVDGPVDRDFRWVLNMGGDDFHGNHELSPTKHHHQAQEMVQTDQHQPQAEETPQTHGLKTQTITINQGKFYTVRKYKVIKVAPGSKEGEEIYVADRIGCDVELKAGQMAVLEYDGANNKREQIKFLGGQGKHYKIKVSNTRVPAAKPAVGQHPEKKEPPRPGDFRHYYELFDIPQNQQFEIWSPGEYRKMLKEEAQNAQHAVAAASTDYQHPCDPVACGCES